ncbi:MAG: hypothetical protein HY785_24925 [Oscillatoriophycideae cyanobacterium NC_groundwater_1537_Pr4_S-0.65um_50_18]|nr:hypothetical protein [Oscillatoriophycideae cyanobacterium NC_groundwater_1537_Pr4_S-0.65um_50_18]
MIYLSRTKMCQAASILTFARKIKHEFPIWKAEEDPLTGVVYWNALKAKLPRWRSSGETRQLWQRALRDRSKSAIIDPDLIGPSDLKNPVPGNPTFDLWQARSGEVSTQLAQLAAEPQTSIGLDINFQAILGISIAQLIAIAADQEKGNIISDRLAQLSLETAEFNYLFRIAKLANQVQPILDLEWENLYSILVQVWKRRQAAQWRSAEKAQMILLSSDLFQIPPPAALQFPPKERTVVDIWRSPKVAYQDWQDGLQSRIDQERTTIQALAEAVSSTEEATLPLLRDALILAISLPGDLEVKAKWVTENLLIDAKMSGCSLTTRVAQAIETLQSLILALRTGQLEDLYRTFQLNLDGFDQKWKWLGSYASWRAAMFVFLYPENILQPSLRKWQTPAFQSLLKETGGNRKLTPADACLQAKKYSEYLQDIATLRVEASCTSRTRLTKGDGCSKTDDGYRCLFYMFGRGGLTGKVYWSAYDLMDSVNYTQTFWREVKIENFENIISILGAVPYQVDSKQRYIFLFGKKQDGAVERLVCAKYDLEHSLTWCSELLPLDVPDKETRFEAVVKQTEFENEPPHLVFRLYSPRTVKIPVVGTFIANHKERKINISGDGWESEDFKPLYASPARKLLSMVSDKKDRNLFHLFQEDNQGNINMIPFYPGTSFYYSYSGVTIKDEDRDRFTIIGAGQIFYGKYVGVFCLGQFSPFLLILPFKITARIPEYELYVIHHFANRTSKITSPFPVPLDNLGIRPAPASLIPTWGIAEYGNDQKKRLVFRSDNAPAEIFRLLENDNPLRFTLMSRQSVTPLLYGLFEIPNRLSESELQIRRSLVQAVYQRNFELGVSVYTYLEEAYYFVPIHLALALYRSGEYLAALDLLRTVYDYTTDVNRRKIYYGLIAEESIANTYKRSPDWLRDPLNPHAIAATRQNTYTRFTLLTIIRCLLDYADAEFTQDTSESNPRARRLYLTAQELLKTRELQQSLNQCEEIIGILDDIPVSDDRWQGNIHQIKAELKAIPDAQRLQPIVNQIQQVLIDDAPLEQRFASAKSILAQAIAALPPASNLTSVIQKNESFSQVVQRSMLSDEALTTALESVSTTATEDFQRTVSMVTEISTSRLAMRSVSLPWLREPIPRLVNPEQAQAAVKLTSARRDAARLDVLAPSYTATLAQVAAGQPMTAINQAAQVPIAHMPQLISSFCIPPNPLLKSLRLRADLNLHKLRTCRNIAGMKRQLEPYAAPTDTTTGLPSIGAGGQLLLPGVVRLQPTLYRYQVLIERTKQLVQLAGQIEAALLASLEKRDNEAFTLLKARQELGLAQSGIRLQSLRLKEANDGTKLAELRKKRTEIQVQTYGEWIQADLNEYEQQMISAYKVVEESRNSIAQVDGAIQVYQAAIGVAGAGWEGAAAAAFAATGMGIALLTKYSFQQNQSKAEKELQIASLYANRENREQEWQLQLELSNQDVIISDQEIVLASDRVEIVTQEKVISELQASNAKDTIEFLSTKFTNVNLYDWMSGILEEVYRFFLQQATSTAKLSENQLAFERQEVPPAYIQSDYWTAPSDGTGSNALAPDRKGLTGSARLLQDIYQLDQYAFNTNKRKLQLSKTLSLAILAPAEFQRFRETGVMIFATPTEMFDRDFPGHYLRLIRRVRTSVIALIPPTQGIHATLTTTGLSRTVIGPDIFQTVSIRRDPELVALTSPINSTGILELEPQQTDMLLPFEGNGVDSTWEFRMPKASNQFNYRSIADVLITIEYTALNSFDYREQVIQTLKPNLSADRPFSFRNQFADQWYDLNNPEQTKTPLKVKFQTFREDFPPNVETLKVQQVLLYFVRTSEKIFELPITTLRFTEQGNQGTVGGSAAPIDGVISTRRGNAGSWTAIIGKSPIGNWELILPNTEEVKKHFQDEKIDDILFVITYAGRTPDWPT